MISFRVDNRLVHGQIIEAWLPYLKSTHLVVVNDTISVDLIRQQIIRLAVPSRVALTFTSLKEVKSFYDLLFIKEVTAFFIMANCCDALKMQEQGIIMPTLNIGNIHYEEGKKQLCAHIAVSEEDICYLKNLEKNTTKLDFRSVPDDIPRIFGW